MDFDVTEIPSEFLYELFQQYACDFIKTGNDKNDGYEEQMETLIPWLMRVENELARREITKGGVMKSLVEHFNMSEAWLQDAVEVIPKNNDDEIQKNRSSGGVSSADAECQNNDIDRDEDSPALYTKRVAKCFKISYKPNFENFGSRSNRNRYRNKSRRVPKTPWLSSNLHKSVVKLPGKHWKVRYEDPPPPKRRKQFWSFRDK